MNTPAPASFEPKQADKPRVVYAWKDGDKYKASLHQKNDSHHGLPDKPRAANVYETATALISDAAKRGFKVEWEDGFPD